MSNKLNFYKKRHIVFLSITILIIVTGLPLLSLLLNIFKEEGIPLNTIINIRRMKVLLKTISFACLVSLLSSFIGLFLAICVYTNKKILFPIFIISVLFISIPPYIHALSWIEFSSIFDKPILSGVGISTLVQTIYYIPFAALLFYTSIIYIDQSYFYEAKMNTTNTKAVFITVKELSSAPFSISFLIIFLLSINDYTIPSIYTFNTYPIEIMTIFSSSSGLLKTTLVAFPSLLISVIVSFAVYRIFSIYYSQYKINTPATFKNNKNNIPLITLFILMVSIQISIPIIFLLFDIESIKAIIPSVLNNYEDILFTFICVLISSIIIIVFTSIFAYSSIINKKFKTFCMILSILQIGVPGSFSGIAIISMYNKIIPDSLYYSPLLTSHALLFRFMPIAFFIIFADFNKFKNEYFDAALLNTNNYYKIFKQIILPNSYLSIAFAFIVVSVLGIGELSATIMVIPPGKSTLSVTIYNYLHYGSSSSVKGLSSFVFLSCVLFTMGIIVISLKSRKIGVRKT